MQSRHRKRLEARYRRHNAQPSNASLLSWIYRSWLVLTVAVALAGLLSACDLFGGGSDDEGSSDTPAETTDGGTTAEAAPATGDAATQPLGDSQPPSIEASGSAETTPQGENATPPPVVPEVSFEEKASRTTPVVPAPIQQKVGTAMLAATPCQIQGYSFVGADSDVIGRLEIGSDGAVYVLQGERQIRRFTLNSTDSSCTLTADMSYGTGGAADPGNDIEELTALNGNKLIASSGVGNSHRISNGQSEVTCKAFSQGRIVSSFEGDMALGYFVSPPLRRITYSDSDCTSEDWNFEMPLSNINVVNFVHGNILVGGVMSKQVNPGEPRIVVSFNKQGEEVMRFGNTDDGFHDDRFGWVAAIEECGEEICVVDPNSRRLSVWGKSGQFVGSANLMKLFGVRYPWVHDIEVPRGSKGVAYATATQEREGDGEGVYDGFVFMIMGFGGTAVPEEAIPPVEAAAPPPEGELGELLAERDRLNKQIARLNRIVDRDINTNPTAKVRLNRWAISSTRDRVRLNQLARRRRDVNRRIEELGGPAPGTATPTGAPPAGETPPAPGAPPAASSSAPIPQGAPDELAQLQARRERLTAEINQLNRRVDNDVNSSPSAKVRLNRYPMSSTADRERLNRLVRQRRAIDARIQELQGQ